MIPEPAATGRAEPDPTDTAKAWLRLVVAVLLSTIGGVGMWSVVVALPAIQADFGVSRADASLPYTLAMLGFGAGGIVMGRLADRFGVAVPLALGTLALGVGYLAVGQASTLWEVALAHGLLIGLGCSASFGPLMADMSHWFVRRRGIAVAIAASGNYHRRHDLAAGGAAFHRDGGLARDPYRHRRVPARQHAAARLLPAAAHAGASH